MTEINLNEELVIDESNFEQYFFDVRKHKPKKGQVMATFRARAELIDGQMKEHLVYLLKLNKGGESCVKVLHKLGCATYEEAVRLSIEMAEDLLNNMSERDVINKIYEYDYEQFFYTQKENVPTDDPHWTTIDLANLDEHLEKTEQGEVRSKIIPPTAI